jgi:hypothetical protein
MVDRQPVSDIRSPTGIYWPAISDRWGDVPALGNACDFKIRSGLLFFGIGDVWAGFVGP